MSDSKAREAAARAVAMYCRSAVNTHDTSSICANAAIDAYLAAQWQPIETAPKDGTTILMWEGSPWVASAFNRDGEFIGWDADSHFLDEPTHWMPITPPAAPPPARE